VHFSLAASAVAQVVRVQFWLLHQQSQAVRLGSIPVMLILQEYSMLKHGIMAAST
jgi:hypothetical protein